MLNSTVDAGTGTLARYFVDGPTYIDEHLLVHDEAADEDQYYLLRELYSVIGLSDETGALVESCVYDAYGKAQMYDATQSPIAFSSVGNRYAFTGRRLDAFQSFVANPRLDLYHYRARAYDPFHGRFLQRDPIGYAGGGMNLYEYALSRSTTLTDPLGTKPLKCPKGQISVSKGISVPANGCGSGWTQYIVPDRWPLGTRKVRFTPACNIHDKCYGDCKKSKAQCDRAFREDLQVACIHAYQFTLDDLIWMSGKMTLTAEGQAKEKARKFCMKLVARVYQAAVSSLGEGAHTKSQKQHCKCCTPKKKP